MYSLRIAARYLAHKRICLLAMVGVALGVTALLVTHSVMTGFRQNIRQRIRGALSDLIVEKWDEEYFGDYEPLLAQIEALDHVAACSPHLDGLALVKLGKRDEYRYAMFMGVDLERELKVSRLAEYWANARQKEGASGLPDQPTWDAGTSGAVRSEGDYERAPAIVGSEVLVRGRDPEGRTVALQPGDDVVLVTATSAFERGLLPCRIAGTFKSGMYEYDQRHIYVPLDRAQRDLVEQPGRVTAIHVSLDDYANAHAVRAAILGIPTLDELRRLRRLLRGALRSAGETIPPPGEDLFAELDASYLEWRDAGNPKYVRACLTLGALYAQTAATLRSAGALARFSGAEELNGLLAALEARRQRAPGPLYRVSTWEDRQRNFLRAVDIERVLIVVILSFFFLLGGFTIYAILSSMVVEKTKDVGTLKAVGAPTTGILSIFLFTGLLIGLVGSALGTLGGVLFCRHINAIADVIYRLTGLTVFPSDIYYLDRIPVDERPGPWIAAIAVAAVAVSVLASLVPALRAARMDPVESLRYE